MEAKHIQQPVYWGMMPLLLASDVPTLVTLLRNMILGTVKCVAHEELHCFFHVFTANT